MNTVLFALALAAPMLVVERVLPGRQWPRVHGWWVRALALNVVHALIVVVAGVGWEKWMLDHRPWSATSLGHMGGALAGYVTITFAYYWWHRWRHESALLWRWFHQVHHSPARIELVTSFYKHPVEILTNGILSSAVLYLLVGLDCRQATTAVALTAAAELFYHWNIRTPAWLGFLIQRPESHCAHHERGVHTRNYSDLPLWDIVFGTFENPREWSGACGFGFRSERHLFAMLGGWDISAERAP